MPQLPSGQHIAVDPAPLNNLLLESKSPFNAHHLMAIEPVDDLYRWLDLLLLKPAESLVPDDARLRPPMARQLADVRETQEALRKTPTLAGAFACMWKEGVHPLQSEPE